MKVQILDVDYVMTNQKPVVRIFGRTDEGKSVCLFHEGFYPYFYVKCDQKKSEFEKLLEKFNGEVREVKKVNKKIPLGYKEKPDELFKVVNTTPSKVPEIRNFLLDKGMDVYEADIFFKYRFMVDHNIKGMEWAEVKTTKTFTKTVSIPSYKIKNIKPIDKTGNSELRYLSFDIECVSKNPDRLPDAKTDPVIIISLAFNRNYHGKKTMVLSLKNSEGCKGFNGEEKMLKEFLEIIKEYDPDIITGYNVNNFDLPYIFERLKKYNVPATLGRCEKKQAYAKKFGYSTTVNIPGRAVMDSYQIIKSDPYMKFKRYTLNNVAKNMLDDEKKDVKPKEMAKLWNGSKKDVKKFIDYGRKDAVLALRLIIEKNLLDKYFELSKVSGLVLQDAVGGQAIRVETCFLHKFRERGYVMPAKPNGSEISRRRKEREEIGLKGGFVLSPEKGLHSKGCILVLDFKSLYPSIMITHNICPSALLKDGKKEKKHKGSKSPSGSRFVDTSVHRGLLPEVVNEILDARAKAKKEMYAAKTKEKRKLMDAKQYALKIMANSFYGYTGYFRARLYMVEVAAAITSFGRELIKKSKKLCEEEFDAKVIYGDTDSIFVKVKTNDLDKAAKLGEDICERINKTLSGVLELEFEKIYRTFLILTKKRYAAWKFEKQNGKWENSIDMKGIETVRRDWCDLVSSTMKDVISMILKEGDVKKAMSKVKDIVEKLKSGEVELEKLAIVKGITKKPSEYDGTLPHIELAKKMSRRDATTAPVAGERIAFVIIKGNQMLSKRAESPEYVKENSLEIDPDYYIHSQLLPPLERIFSSLGVNKTELLGLGRQMNFFEVVNGSKRKLNHNVAVKHSQTLEGFEEFTCKSCKKTLRRPPLTGKCSCGGNIEIVFQGSSSDRCKV